MLKRILVALTGTPCGETAIRHAVELAEAHKARLTGVTLVDVRRIKNVGSIPIGAGDSAKELREHRMSVVQQQIDEAVEDFLAACKPAGIEPQIEMEEGNPCSRMIELARYHDLNVFGLRGLLGFGHPGEAAGLLGPLVKNGVRPLLAVAEEYRPIRRALIAYSGSKESAKTMRRFAQFRAWPEVEADIAVFHHPAAMAEKLIADATAYFADHGLKTRGEHFAETAKKGILAQAAAQEADLIVMGYSVHSRFRQLLLGETGLHIFKNTDRSLFLAQ